MSLQVDRSTFFESLLLRNLTKRNIIEEIDRIILGFGFDYILLLEMDLLKYILELFRKELPRSTPWHEQFPQIARNIKYASSLKEIQSCVQNWIHLMENNEYNHHKKNALQIYGAFAPAHIGHLALCRVAKKYHNEKYHNRYSNTVICICPLKFHTSKSHLAINYLDRVIELRNSFSLYNDLLVVDIEGDCTLPKTKQIRQLELISKLSGGYIPQLVFGGDVFLKDYNACKIGSKESLIDRGYFDLYISPRKDDDVDLIKKKIAEARSEFGNRFYLLPQTNFIETTPSSTFARKMIESIGYNPIAIG